MRYELNIDERVRINEEFMHKAWKLPAYVSIVGTITEETSKKFREDMEFAERIAFDAKQDVIPVVIDSYGGDAYALMGMIDSIQACKLKVATVVESKAMSAGAMLFSFGTEGYRYIGPNATLMIHPALGANSLEKIHEMKANTEELNRLHDLIFKKVAQNCGKTPNYFVNILKERMNADWYLNAQEAVEHNLANHIKIPAISVSVTMSHTFG